MSLNPTSHYPPPHKPLFKLLNQVGSWNDKQDGASRDGALTWHGGHIMVHIMDMVDMLGMMDMVDMLGMMDIVDMVDMMVDVVII